MRGISVEPKLALAVGLLSVAAGLAGAAVVGAHVERRVEAVGAQLLAGAVDDFRAQQQGEVEKLSATLDALMAAPDLQAAFAARDRERLLALAAPTLATLRERDRITHWYFFLPEPSPRVFLRVHRPDLRGDTPARVSLQRTAGGAEVGAGLELGRTAFALRVVRPWVVGGRLLGYMELAEEIDHFLGTMKGRTGDEYGLLVKKRYLDEAAWAAAVGPRAATWNDRPDVLVVDTTSVPVGVLDWPGDLEQLPDEGIDLGELRLGERTLLRGLFPIRDAGQRPVGALFVLHDFTTHHGAVTEARAFALAAMGLAALVAAAGAAVLARLLVFRRLARLRVRLEGRAGDRPGGAGAEMWTHDDLGRLEALFTRALEQRPGPAGDEPPRRA